MPIRSERFGERDFVGLGEARKGRRPCSSAGRVWVQRLCQVAVCPLHALCGRRRRETKHLPGLAHSHVRLGHA